MKTSLTVALFLAIRIGAAQTYIEPDPSGKVVIPNPPLRGKALATVSYAKPKPGLAYDPANEVPDYLTPNANYDRDALPMHGPWHGQAPGTLDLGDVFGNDATSKFFSSDGIGKLPSGGPDPGDPDMAVGLRYMVQVVNRSYAVYDKCGRKVFERTFGSLVGTTQGSLFDPKVIYDPYAKRWVMLILRNDAANKVATTTIIVSADDDPSTDNWWYYDFPTTTGTDPNKCWSDYYELGYSANALYASGNQFKFSNDAYQGGQILIIKKAEAYSHVAASYWKPQLPSTVNTDDTFGLRAAEMMTTPGAYDVVFTSTNRLGGSHLHVRKLADPFGAQTLTYGKVKNASNVEGIFAYSTAPAAQQPPADVLFSFDTRPMNLMVARDTADNTLHAWTGFMVAHDWGGGNQMAIRTVNFNPDTLVKRFDGDVGAADRDYCFPYLVANYNGQAVLGFGRSGHTAPNYPEVRWLVIEGLAYSFSDRIYPTNPTKSFTGDDRWGDYFGGSLDWADYLYGIPAGTAGKHKYWVLGKWARDDNEWDTGAGAVGINTTVGTLAVSGGNPVAYYFVGQTGTPTYTWTVHHNAGDVGFTYRISVDKNWLTPLTRTWGEVSKGRTEDVRYQVNANALALPAGRHVATLTFTNCYTGGTVQQTVTLSIGKKMCAIGWAAYEGTRIGGNLQDTCVSDNQDMVMISDDISLATDLYFSTNEGIDHSTKYEFHIEAASGRYGLAQSVYLFSVDTNQWVQFDGRIAPVSDVLISVYLNSPDPFISSNGTTFGRIRTAPINDEDPQSDGWILGIDYVQFVDWP